MASLSLQEIAQKMNGKILQGNPSLHFDTYNFDSRLSLQGELFFALKGDRDGHDYVPHAFRSGAAGAVVSRDIPAPSENFALIRVKDTLRALQELARKVLDSFDIKVIGITGSVGKTTTKVFVSSLLEAKYRVIQSERNYNNHIGLPLSLLKLTETHDVAVLEMAMSAPGEISVLTGIARPHYAVITNIKPVHIEFFDSIQDIALAKKEILDGMNRDGTVVVNGDDPLVNKISSGWKGEKITFGFSPDCDIQARNVQNASLDGIKFDLSFQGAVHPLTLRIFYKSYLLNFLAAAGIASVFSLTAQDIFSKISDIKPPAMRGQLFRLKNNVLLIDDSYNSNPFALESALADLSGMPCSKRTAVLGDMLELGKDASRYHRAAGKTVYETGWDRLVTVGPLSTQIADGAVDAGLASSQVWTYQDSAEAAEEIPGLLSEGDLVLVKGSRGIKMEAIAEKIKRKGS